MSKRCHVVPASSLTSLPERPTAIAVCHEDVEPYLAVVRPRDREGLTAEIERSQAEPEEFGRREPPPGWGR